MDRRQGPVGGLVSFGLGLEVKGGVLEAGGGERRTRLWSIISAIVARRPV
jgi:hypothetical protein